MDEEQKTALNLIKALNTIQESLTSIKNRLSKLEKTTVESKPVLPVDHVLISCDGSILKNPGGPSTAASVIQQPKLPPVEVVRATNATTNNEAEFDAVYLGLSTLAALNFMPSTEVEVQSDSRVVIDGLNKTKVLKAPKLIKKRDLILELVKQFSAGVKFVWKKRNSSPGLARANNLAQVANGVKPH